MAASAHARWRSAITPLQLAPSDVGSIVRFTAGTQSSSAFNAAGLTAISKTQRTQARLRFSQSQASTQYIWIGSGVDASLRVEYQP